MTPLCDEARIAVMSAQPPVPWWNRSHWHRPLLLMPLRFSRGLTGMDPKTYA